MNYFKLIMDYDPEKSEIIVYRNKFKICSEREMRNETRVTYNIHLGDFNNSYYSTVESLPKFIVSGVEALVYSYNLDGSLAASPEAR